MLHPPKTFSDQFPKFVFFLHPTTRPENGHMSHNRKPMNSAPFGVGLDLRLVLRLLASLDLSIVNTDHRSNCYCRLVSRYFDRGASNRSAARRRHFHFICQSTAQLATGRRGVAATKVADSAHVFPPLRLFDPQHQQLVRRRRAQKRLQALQRLPPHPISDLWTREILEMRASLKKNIDRTVGTRKCTKLWLRYLLNISTGDQSMRSRQPTQLTSLVGLDVRMMRPANLSLLSGRIKSQIVQSVGCTTSCRSLADVRRMLGEPIDFRPSERQSAPLLMNKTRPGQQDQDPSAGAAHCLQVIDCRNFSAAPATTRAACRNDSRSPILCFFSFCPSF